MSEPDGMEELAPVTRELLDRALADDPAPERVDALRDRLAHLMDPGGGGGGEPAPAPSPPTLSGSQVGLMVAAVTLASIFGGWAWLHRGAPEAATEDEQAPATAAPPASVELAPLADGAPSEGPNSEGPNSEPTPAASRSLERPTEEPTRLEPPDPTPRSPHSGMPRGGGLEEAEARYVRHMRRRLTSSPERVLRMARRHPQRFPRPLLAEEVELLRIEALVALGRTQSARDAWEAFDRAHPGSAHRRRILQQLD